MLAIRAFGPLRFALRAGLKKAGVCFLALSLVVLAFFAVRIFARVYEARDSGQAFVERKLPHLLLQWNVSELKALAGDDLYKPGHFDEPKVDDVFRRVGRCNTPIRYVQRSASIQTGGTHGGPAHYASFTFRLPCERSEGLFFVEVRRLNEQDDWRVVQFDADVPKKKTELWDWRRWF